MRLQEYLTARGETQIGFSRRAGLAQPTINSICRGAACSAATALAIIRATHSHPTPGGGTVALEDLVVSDEKAGAA